MDQRVVGPGHNNPPLEERVRINVPPVQVPGSENILDYPKKYRTEIEQNERLFPCCRQAVYHTCETFKTPTCQPGFPFDLFVATCQCGRKHRRLLVGNVHQFIKERR
jgi:hypothetical protein